MTHPAPNNIPIIKDTSPVVNNYLALSLMSDSPSLLFHFNEKYVYQSLMTYTYLVQDALIEYFE